MTLSQTSPCVGTCNRAPLPQHHHRIALFGIQSICPHFGRLSLEVYTPLRSRGCGPGARMAACYMKYHNFGKSKPHGINTLSCQAGFGLPSGQKKLRFMPAKVTSSTASSEVDLAGDGIADDYYSVLGVTHEATPEEIKKAYYSCMKACHPDLAGEHLETTSFCMFVNEVYEVLSDPVQRMVYDEINGYSLKSINPFLDISKSRDYVFVDEFSCIGCKNCANTAPKTFDIEEDFGRARVVSQCGRVSAVQQAIETCPVDCIHWVTAAQLSLLEDEMRRIERVNVGVMLSGMGSSASDVFTMANRRWEKKQARAVEAAKIRVMKEKRKGKNGQWWQNVWNQDSEGSDVENPVDAEIQERAAKAAAAARRWREYSRKGADRRPIYNLPPICNSESDDECETSAEMAKN